MALKVKIEKKEDGLIYLSLEGSIDTEAYAFFQQKMSSVIAMSPRVMMIDMGKVDYVSSLGIGAIVETKKEVEAIGGRMIMTNMQPQVKKVFEIVETLPNLNMFESAEEADEYLFRIQEQMKEKKAEEEDEAQAKKKHRNEEAE